MILAAGILVAVVAAAVAIAASGRVSLWYRRGGVIYDVGFEAEVVVRAFGRRVRFYAGHGFADRPRVHLWRGYGSRGLALRAHRGVREQRVLGIQWRRTT